MQRGVAGSADHSAATSVWQVYKAQGFRRMPDSVCTCPWPDPGWGQKLGCLVHDGPYCQVICQKLSSGFPTKKQNSAPLELGDPGCHPAQPLPKRCPCSIYPPRCSMGGKKKKKRFCGQRSFRKRNCIDSAVGDSVHIHIIRSLKDAAVKKPAYLYSDINALRKKMTCPRSHKHSSN